MLDHIVAECPTLLERMREKSGEAERVTKVGKASSVDKQKVLGRQGMETKRATLFHQKEVVVVNRTTPGVRGQLNTAAPSPGLHLSIRPGKPKVNPLVQHHRPNPTGPWEPHKR